MCKIDHLFSAEELKALGPKERDKLKKRALHHVRNSPEIHKIISEHSKVRTIMKKKPHPKFRKAMRKKLRSTFNQLKNQSP
jgi:hypothetical protein